MCYQVLQLPSTQVVLRLLWNGIKQESLSSYDNILTSYLCFSFSNVAFLQSVIYWVLSLALSCLSFFVGKKMLTKEGKLSPTLLSAGGNGEKLTSTAFFFRACKLHPKQSPACHDHVCSMTTLPVLAKYKILLALHAVATSNTGVWPAYRNSHCVGFFLLF